MSNRTRALIIWLIVSFLMVLHFFLMLSVGVITGDLRSELRLSALELSILSSAYLYIYVVLQTPVGVLLDIFGSRKLLSVGGLVCAFGCWMFAYSNTFLLSVFARILMGGGLSFVFVAAIYLAAKWFHTRWFGMMIGLAETAGVLGAIVGNVILAFFVDSLGWRGSFYVSAVIALVLSALVWLLVRDHPHGSLLDPKKKPNLFSVVKNLKIIIREPDIWLHSGYMALIYIAVTVFSGLWATPFLLKAFNMSLEQATVSTSVLLIAFGLGSPLIGFVFTKVRSQVSCMIWFSLLMFVALCALLYAPDLSLWQINVLMGTIGFTCSASILSFAIISDQTPETVKSTSIGFINTQSLFSAILFQPIIGWILNILSDDVSVQGVEIYTANQYRIALSVLPTLVFVSFVLGVMIRQRESKRKPK